MKLNFVETKCGIFKPNGKLMDKHWRTLVQRLVNVIRQFVLLVGINWSNIPTLPHVYTVGMLSFLMITFKWDGSQVLKKDILGL